MTTGQLLFYGGVALLGLTVILAIIFFIADPGRTQRLRNGYPTDRVTVRRDSPRHAPPDEDLEDTELLSGVSTELMTEIESSDSQQMEHGD